MEEFAGVISLNSGCTRCKVTIFRCVCKSRDEPECSPHSTNEVSYSCHEETMEPLNCCQDIRTPIYHTVLFFICQPALKPSTLQGCILSHDSIRINYTQKQKRTQNQTGTPYLLLPRLHTIPNYEIGFEIILDSK